MLLQYLWIWRVYLEVLRQSLPFPQNSEHLSLNFVSPCHFTLQSQISDLMKSSSNHMPCVVFQGKCLWFFFLLAIFFFTHRTKEILDLHIVHHISMFCRHICLKIWQPSGIIVGKHFSCYIIKCKYFAITGYFFFSFFLHSLALS